MSLTSGTRLGPYEVTAQIGMGEVYLAEDTSLDRKVALKFLAEPLAKSSFQDMSTRPPNSLL
ncbi:serine/threonine protein kinase, partial [Acidobacteria bacterium AH-259-O06]|nr:serine/threonine protein kinase [Acidobacteria bacterium AH-259-O06]